MLKVTTRRQFLTPGLPGQDAASLRLSSLPETKWTETTIFLPKHWIVYKQLTRTSNDKEGWHNALNRSADGQSALPLQLCIELLEKEVRLTIITIRLVSNEELPRI